MDIDKMPRRVRSALRERGHADNEIANMTPREVIKEFAGWHLGDPDWGAEFFDLIKELEKAQ